MSVSITSLPSQPSSSLSVYEQERQKNIEKNKAVLAELGLGDARKQLIETHKKDVVEKIKRRYTKKSFPIETPRRSARIQGKPVRYTDGFGSEDENDESRKPSSATNNALALTVTSPSGTNTALSPLKRKYSFYDIEDEITTRPKYKNELTTCHFCRKRDRKPKTRCSTCGVKYWVGDCCRSCFEQHFEDEDFDEVMMNKNWVCYCCRKKCPCLECIAGITKGRRYGPRKFKDAPKEDFTTTQSNFSGVVPDQFSLFSPLPLPSFLNYNSTAPALHFPMLPQPHFAPPSSPPRPSSPTFSSAPNSFSSPSFSSPNSYSPFPSPSLFSPLGCTGNNGNSMSSYSGGFPSLHSAFGNMSSANMGNTMNGSSSGVSPQNIFGLMSSPLPTLSLPPPHPSTQPQPSQQSSLSHFLSSPPSFMNNYSTREPEGLGNGAMCGFKMAQVIAQITNAPTPANTGFSYLQPNFNSFTNTNNMLNTTTLASLNTNTNNSNNFLGVARKPRSGRKPKGFNFAFHTSESISSDPMSNDVYDQPTGDLLPPIKIPTAANRKPRGRPKNKDLPALSVEEEAMSMNMSTAEENIDGLGGDPPTPVLSPPPTEKKKRGRPKGTGPSKTKTSKYGGRPTKKRGRKPKSYSFSSPTSPSSEIPCTPPMQSPSPSASFGDEFFNNSNDDLLYDDDMFNEMELGLIQPFGGSHPHLNSSTTLSSDDLAASGGAGGGAGGIPMVPGGGIPVNEQLKVRVKAPSLVYSPTLMQKKRGRRPKKSSNKIKIVKENYEKRKYTKRKVPRDAEDTSNLRRSTRPPQASKAFDDHYLL